MLPQFRTYILVNNSGQTLTYDSGGRINVKETAYYISPSTGLITYVPLDDDDLDFGAGESVANGAEVIGDVEIVNTGNKYIGAQLQLEITHDAGAAADGTFDLYMDAGDATGELANDATGYAGAEANVLQLIGSLVWESNGGNGEVMRSQIFEL